MSKKNLPTGEATPAGNMDRTAGQSPLCAHFTPLRGEFQGRIAPLLGRGEQHATPTAQLLALTGIRDTRRLRAQIRREREAGVLILSTVRGRGGYFLPDEGEQGRLEIEAFVRTVSARAINSQATLRAARRALREVDGQVEIDGGSGE